MQYRLPRDWLLNVRQRFRQSRLNGVFIDLGRHRDAQRHERLIIIGIPNNITTMEEHDSGLRHHIIDGFTLHPTVHPDIPVSVWHRASELGRVADSSRVERAYHLDR